MSGPYDYNGGLALRGPAGCPEGTIQCSTGLQDRCCDSSQVCFTNEEGAVNGNTAYCCPDDNDCIGSIQDAAKCADPSWELCYSTYNNTGWCCQGEYPVCFTAPAGVGCAAGTQDLLSNDVVVATVYPVGQTFPTTPSTTSVPVAASSTAPATGGGGYDESDKIALGVGIGLGLPATLAAIVTLVYLIRRR